MSTSLKFITVLEKKKRNLVMEFYFNLFLKLSLLTSN
jgi:hypothetical protein